MAEDYNEFEQEMESLRQEISKLIKNHLISRYTEEYLQAKLPHFSSVDDNIEMLTQTILITFSKFALEHGWFEIKEYRNSKMEQKISNNCPHKEFYCTNCPNNLTCMKRN